MMQIKSKGGVIIAIIVAQVLQTLGLGAVALLAALNGITWLSIVFCILTLISATAISLVESKHGE